jgi:hypothetical protein
MRKAFGVRRRIVIVTACFLRRRKSEFEFEFVWGTRRDREWRKRVLRVPPNLNAERRTFSVER